MSNRFLEPPASSGCCARSVSRVRPDSQDVPLATDGAEEPWREVATPYQAVPFAPCFAAPSLVRVAGKRLASGRSLPSRRRPSPLEGQARYHTWYKSQAESDSESECLPGSKTWSNSTCRDLPTPDPSSVSSSGGDHGCVHVPPPTPSSITAPLKTPPS